MSQNQNQNQGQPTTKFDAIREQNMQSLSALRNAERDVTMAQLDLRQSQAQKGDLAGLVSEIVIGISKETQAAGQLLAGAPTPASIKAAADLLKSSSDQLYAFHSKL